MARLICLLILGMAACGDPPPSKYPTNIAVSGDAKLSTGDVFDVRVYKHKELSSTYRVGNDGTITYPYLGEITAAGKTPKELEGEIQAGLANGVLREPYVSVFVKEYASKRVSVFGEVNKAGTFEYAEGMTIVDGISQAGGFSPRAKKNATTVTRMVDDEKKRFTVPVESIGEGKADNFFLRPGDVIFVPKRAW